MQSELLGLLWEARRDNGIELLKLPPRLIDDGLLTHVVTGEKVAEVLAWDVDYKTWKRVMVDEPGYKTMTELLDDAQGGIVVGLRLSLTAKGRAIAAAVTAAANGLPTVDRQSRGWYGKPVAEFMAKFSDDDEANMKQFVREWNKANMNQVKYGVFRARVSDARKKRTLAPVHKKSTATRCVKSQPRR